MTKIPTITSAYIYSHTNGGNGNPPEIWKLLKLLRPIIEVKAFPHHAVYMATHMPGLSL